MMLEDRYPELKGRTISEAIRFLEMENLYADTVQRHDSVPNRFCMKFTGNNDEYYIEVDGEKKVVLREINDV